MKQASKSFWMRIGSMMLIYLVLAAGMYWVVADDWSVTAVKVDSVSQGYLLPVNSEITQHFQTKMDGLDQITLVPHFERKERSGNVDLYLMNQDTMLWHAAVPVTEWTNDEVVSIAVEPAVQCVDELTLRILPNETGLSLWAGTTVNAGRYEVPISVSGLEVNGEAVEGGL